jgi:hypothetical protein
MSSVLLRTAGSRQQVFCRLPPPTTDCSALFCPVPAGNVGCRFAFAVSGMVSVVSRWLLLTVDVTGLASGARWH